MKAIQYQAYGSYEENRLVELDCPKPKDARSGSVPDRGSPIRPGIDAGIALWKSYRTLIEPSYYPYHRLIVWHPPSWRN